MHDLLHRQSSILVKSLILRVKKKKERLVKLFACAYKTTDVGNTMYRNSILKNFLKTINPSICLYSNQILIKKVNLKPDGAESERVEVCARGEVRLFYALPSFDASLMSGI